MKAKKPKGWQPPSPEEILNVIEKVKSAEGEDSRYNTKKRTYVAHCLGLTYQAVWNWLNGNAPINWCQWYTLNSLPKDNG